jgi:hypothetical protein
MRYFALAKLRAITTAACPHRHVSRL